MDIAPMGISLIKSILGWDEIRRSDLAWCVETCTPFHLVVEESTIKHDQTCNGLEERS